MKIKNIKNSIASKYSALFNHKRAVTDNEETREINAGSGDILAAEVPDSFNARNKAVWFRETIRALRIVFADPLFLFLGVSIGTNLLLLYYFIFLQTTTFGIFWASNTAFYDIISLLLAVAISVLFGIAMSFVAWQWREKKGKKLAVFGNGAIGAFFGAVATGCPVCGAFLVSLLGIGGGLAAFPFQGLGVKVFSLLLLGYAVVVSGKAITNKTCSVGIPKKARLFAIDGNDILVTLNKNSLKPLKPLVAGIGVIVLIFAFPFIGSALNINMSFQPNGGTSIPNSNALEKTAPSAANILEKVTPAAGYTVNAVYGDIGPRMLSAGVIDLNRFQALYKKSGQKLTDKQLKILTKGSDERITINRDNAYFLINFLWALGLVNNNPILDNGPLTKYGRGKIGNFASTGGWTLGTNPAPELYSSASIIPLDANEQRVLEDFAYNSYRPCCNNSTAFADCNHGMAALGLGEVMAAAGASSGDIFKAQKYFNAYWFPQQYLDLARYFKAKEGKNWEDIEPRLVMGKDYSTASGWSRARNWLAANNLIEKAPSGGGGCGV